MFLAMPVLFAAFFGVICYSVVFVRVTKLSLSLYFRVRQKTAHTIEGQTNQTRHSDNASVW